MATTVPAPVLDTRNGAQIAAQAVGALPPELSDRSDSNPAVVIIEAAGYVLDKLLYQINRWPSAVIQKCLNMVGITLNPAVAATVSQTFTLSAPQQNATVIKTGSLVSTSDGMTVFSTLSDLTIAAYSTPAGTIALTSGSTAVTGTSTAFPTDGSWNNYQIQITGGNWYTIASVASSTSLTLTSSALSTSSGAFNVGPVSGSVSAQATTTGLATNIAFTNINTLQSSPSGVASTSNAANAVGGADLETVAAAISRAAQVFASRDVACSASDYSYFATQTLGQNSRAATLPNTNGTTVGGAAGYVSIAVLSPSWSSTIPVSAQERANVVRDLQSRSFVGATIVDLPATVQSFTASPNLPAAVVYRKASVDATTTQYAIAAAINTYLSPNSYPWDPSKYANGYRPIYTGDLVGAIEALPQVDRVLDINGVPAVGMNWQQTANNVTFTFGSTSATANAGDIANDTKITAGKTFLLDPNTSSTAVYLVTAISGATLTLAGVGSTASAAVTFQGASITARPLYFNSQDTNLTDWTTLPYSNLNASAAAGAASASIIVAGSV